MAAIQVANLKKVFTVTKKAEKLSARFQQIFRPHREDIEAVSGIDLTVEEGEALAFIGPNGAGKSTTIRILTGILHPTSGDASVLGFVPWRDRKKLAFRVGSVFGQKSQLWLHLPPLDTFNLLARIYELDWKTFLKRREELIELFELREFVHTPARKLSLGQRMRCEIAASLLHKPEILFLDEPTIGLDPVAKASIRDLIKRANVHDKVTVFLTSHDAGDIERLCKRVVIINHGKMIFDDSVAALQRNFLNEKEVNLKLGAPFDPGEDLSGISVVKMSEYGVKLRVDTRDHSIEHIITTLLSKYPVQDITIQNPPMEDIIAMIYRGQKEAGR